MTIKEVCERYDITADTLRYYERVGVIPEVTRTKSGIRDYREEEKRNCFAGLLSPIAYGRITIVTGDSIRPEARDGN